MITPQNPNERPQTSRYHPFITRIFPRVLVKVFEAYSINQYLILFLFTPILFFAAGVIIYSISRFFQWEF